MSSLAGRLTRLLGSLCRMAASTEVIRAMILGAEAVVSAGRKPCVLCGRPDDPEGHLCPRLN